MQKTMSKYGNLFQDVQVAREISGVQREESRRNALLQEGFTEQQVAAVSAPPGGVIVVAAGAGSGKTKTLTERVVWLLSLGVPASDILVCTFTRKAAGEMLKRIKSRLPDNAEMPFCGTTHALSLQLLSRAQPELMARIRLLSEDEYTKYAELLVRLAPAALSKLGPKELLLRVQRFREEGDGPADIRILADVWDELLADKGAWDFSMLIRETLLHPPARIFKHILVDEAQDLTALQLAWNVHHSAPSSTRFLCGDQDQSLYSFRGTASGVLADQVAQGARKFVIDLNFRCARLVLAHANNVISHNAGRISSNLRPFRDIEGSVIVEAFDDSTKEILAVQTYFKENPHFVVLARTRDMLIPFQNQGIPAMTIHESKGLEWKNVWVCGLEAGTLPHILGDFEEERRLFYVAITRARDSLVISYAKRREMGAKTITCSPSPFLYELQNIQAN